MAREIEKTRSFHRSDEDTLLDVGSVLEDDASFSMVEDLSGKTIFNEADGDFEGVMRKKTVQVGDPAGSLNFMVGTLGDRRYFKAFSNEEAFNGLSLEFGIGHETRTASLQRQEASFMVDMTLAETPTKIILKNMSRVVT